MTKNILTLIIIAASSFFLFGKKNDVSTNPFQNDWIIIPSERIGSLIKVNVNKLNIIQSIQNSFGSENIKETEFSIGEGETISGFSIYPGTANEIKFHVSKDSVVFKFPGYNSYFSNDSDLSSKTKWQMNNNMKIGSSMAEVQKINGTTFELSGFEWDYPGVTKTWLSGKLPNELGVVFRQTATNTPSQYEKIIGDKTIFSDDPILKKTNPVVNFVYIKWDF